MTIHHAHTIDVRSIANVGFGLAMLMLVVAGAFWAGTEYGLRLARRVPINRTPEDAR